MANRENLTQALGLVAACQTFPNLIKSATGSGEASIIAFVRASIEMGLGHAAFDGIPYAPEDTVVFELALKIGRADIVIFHIDGSASVIEVKDGSLGARCVVAGIGQASLYASQLNLPADRIRRCLMWSPVAGGDSANRALGDACRLAGVVPMLAPSRSARADLVVTSMRSLGALADEIANEMGL